MSVYRRDSNPRRDEHWPRAPLISSSLRSPFDHSGTTDGTRILRKERPNMSGEELPGGGDEQKTRELRTQLPWAKCSTLRGTFARLHVALFLGESIGGIRARTARRLTNEIAHFCHHVDDAIDSDAHGFFPMSVADLGVSQIDIAQQLKHSPLMIGPAFKRRLNFSEVLHRPASSNACATIRPALWMDSTYMCRGTPTFRADLEMR